MQGDPKQFVDRIDEFCDQSGRILVTLTADGFRDTDTWSPLDLTGDVEQQHAALAKRLHRFLKVRVRHYLNGLALACSWQTHCGDLTRGIIGSGFDQAKLYFHGVLESVASVDLQQLLAAGCEEARLAGFVSVDEVHRLLQGEAIAVMLDPRPEDVPSGPPIVVTAGEV